jgi:LysM repeat protein
MFAAVAIIVSTSLGGSQPVAKVSVRVATHPRYWIVQPGQTLVSIAARESISPTLVQHANPSLIATRLIPGQRVRLP